MKSCSRTKTLIAPLGALAIMVLSFNLLHANENLPFLPGLWKFTGSLEPDLGGKGPEDFSECVTDELMDTGQIAEDMERGFGKGSCSVTPTIDGNVLTLNLACKSEVGSAAGLGIYTISDQGRSMAGSMDVTMAYSGMEVTVKMLMSGKHSGQSC